MKKIYLLLLIVLCFFGFSERVEAAQELMCLYKKRSGHDKVLLVQESDGDIYVLKTPDDVGLDGHGWYKSPAVPKWETTSFLGINGDVGNDPVISNGSLTKCPGHHETYDGGAVRFKEDGKRLEKSYNKVNLPSLVTYETMDMSMFGYVSEAKKCSEIADMWLTPYSASGNYIQSCLYYAERKTEYTDVVGKKNTCHIIQLNVDKNNNIHLQQSFPYFTYKGGSNPSQFRTDISLKKLKDTYSGSCPVNVYVYGIRDGCSDSNNGSLNCGWKIDVSLSKENKYYEKYVRKEAVGKNIVDQSLDADGDVTLNFNKINILDCEQLLGNNDELIGLLKTIVNIFKFSVPILLVVFGSIDFCKAIFSGSEDDMKKATKKFVKRVIVAMVLFLVPIMLKFILGIANGIWGGISSDLCGIL